MISSIYFYCQKDFKRIVPEGLIGKKKNIQKQKTVQRTTKIH